MRSANPWLLARSSRRQIPNLPAALGQFARHLGYQAAAFLPIISADKLGRPGHSASQKRGINSMAIQPYANLADLVGTALDRIAESVAQERQLSERQALTASIR